MARWRCRLSGEEPPRLRLGPVRAAGRPTRHRMLDPNVGSSLRFKSGQDSRRQQQPSGRRHTQVPHSAQRIRRGSLPSALPLVVLTWRRSCRGLHGREPSPAALLRLDLLRLGEHASWDLYDDHLERARVIGVVRVLHSKLHGPSVLIGDGDPPLSDRGDGAGSHLDGESAVPVRPPFASPSPPLRESFAFTFSPVPAHSSFRASTVTSLVIIPGHTPAAVPLSASAVANPTDATSMAIASRTKFTANLLPREDARCAVRYSAPTSEGTARSDTTSTTRSSAPEERGELAGHLAAADAAGVGGRGY
jgi:hypothetical protein